jgi:hypothetical protein
MYNIELTERLSVADYLAPANTAASSVNTTGIDMSLFKRLLYEIQIGAITGAGTLSAQLQSCSAANFASGVHNIAGSSITQVTNANPNSIVTIEMRSDEVTTLNPADRYVRLSVTIGTNAVVFGATGYGSDAEHLPANAHDINTVTQRLVV